MEDVERLLLINSPYFKQGEFILEVLKNEKAIYNVFAFNSFQTKKLYHIIN